MSDSIGKNKYQVGSLVEFNRDKYTEEEGKYMPYNEKYYKGKQGFVISVSDTKVSTAKSLEELADSGGEYLYKIRLGLTEIINVPESDIFNPNSKITEAIEKKLRQAQEKKEFKDTEGRIGGSKKEKAAYKTIKLSDLTDIEKDEATAIELIKKDKVYPKVDASAEREKGVSSGAAFLKVKLRESFGSEPPNNKEKRKIFVGYAIYLHNAMQNIYTVKDFDDFRSSKIISNGIEEIIKILQPSLAEEIEGEKQYNKEKANEIEKEIGELDKRIDEEREKIKLKNPQFYKNEDYYDFYKVPTSEKEQYNIYDNLRDDLIREKIRYTKSQTELELNFIASIGQYKGSEYFVTRSIFEEIFGKRFVNFVTKRSDAVNEAFTLAEDYEALSETESAKNIEDRGSWTVIQIETLTKKLEDAKSVVTKEQYDAMFENEGISFSGGEFAKWGRGYFNYKDCKSIEQKEAYKARICSNLNKNIIGYKTDLDKIKQKYRARENNWDWAFDKKTIARKESSELKINSYPPLSFIKRIGGVKILESDITPEFIREKFGFKEVEFGQSLKDTEAKEHIRHFLGAMADLADILNMNVVELNKLGGLSIAFASRGAGKASAHYESLRKVINITKTRGGGALAHEYMHYLDNILPKINRAEYAYNEWASVFSESRYGTKSFLVRNTQVANAIGNIFEYIYKRKINNNVFDSEPVIIKRIIDASEKSFSLPTTFYSYGSPPQSPTDIDSYIVEFRKKYSNYNFIENLRPRDYNILGAIVKKFGFKSYEFSFNTNKSQYYANSIAMSSDYWSRAWELFARAFETYIFDKLSKADRANNYLVSGDYFDRSEGIYPQGEEREQLFLLYDDLMAVIKREYQISDFVAWTDERVDEYIALEGDKAETVEAGVIVSEESDEVVEKIEGNTTAIKDKLKELLFLLSQNKFEEGGELNKNSLLSDKLINFSLTL